MGDLAMQTNTQESRYLVTRFGSTGLLLFAWTLAFSGMGFAQDVIVLKNGDHISGEVKKMEAGDVHIDADYGENVFIINWEEVERIESSSYFAVETSGGTRLSGSIRTDPEVSTRLLIEEQGAPVSLEHSALVSLTPIDAGFWGRFGASVDFGMSLTKANETKQFNTRATATYLTEDWSVDGNVDSLFNTRSDVPKTKRNELGTNFRYFLTDRWFSMTFGSFLQSDELQLDLRSSLGSGIGRYLIRNNRWLLSVNGGGAWTNELFEDPLLSDKNSGEAFGAIEFNAFNIGDLNILAQFSVFPSLSDLGRVRMNFKNDFKWDLPQDLYFSVGFTNNFDSSPPTGTDTSSNDYVFSTSVGWSH
jgi:putative salt-induced outer membrane protein YdiY